MPKVSVIVPTFNGEKKIPVLLKALQNQTFQDFELVVMIDGSTDQTQEVVEAIETIFSKTIVFQANQGRAIVKNNGAKHAKGDILIFYDDDMEPASDSVERHVHFHNTVTGILSGNCLELESPEKTDIQNYKVSLTKKWMRKYSEDISQLTKESLFFTAANCSMRKTLFNELNGFDERLTDAEDYEFALRALQAKLNIFFDKSNFAIHHDMISCQRYIKRQREYRHGRVQVQQLHPYIGLVPNIKPSALKRFVYDVLAQPLFPKLIDSFNVFLILPKSLRYKLYSAVIYAHAEI